MLARSSLALFALLSLACASAAEPTLPDAEDVEAPRSKQALPSAALAVDAEVGALDEDAVRKTASDAMADVHGCYSRGSERLAILDGEIEVLLRIGSEGAVRYALPLASSLGDRATELCILEVLSKRSWPRPVGGREGETRQRFEIRASGRPAVAWSAEDLGSAQAELRSELARCPAGGVTVTVNVDEDGRAMAVGAASSELPEEPNEAHAELLDCAVEAAKRVRYPSPGSWPAKFTIAR